MSKGLTGWFYPSPPVSTIRRLKYIWFFIQSVITNFLVTQSFQKYFGFWSFCDSRWRNAVSSQQQIVVDQELLTFKYKTGARESATNSDVLLFHISFLSLYVLFFSMNCQSFLAIRYLSSMMYVQLDASYIILCFILICFEFFCRAYRVNIANVRKICFKCSNYITCKCN